MLPDYLQTEGERVEWKVSDKDSDGIIQAACAMANDLGDSRREGIVLVGVDNRGCVVGLGNVAKLDEIQQRLSNQLHSTKLVPTPSFDLRSESVGGNHILILTIHPYPVPPAVAVNSVVWVRQGTSTRRATDADLAWLRERRPENRRPFDQRPERSADIEALDETRLHAEYDAERTTTGSSSRTPAGVSAGLRRAILVTTQTIGIPH